MSIFIARLCAVVLLGTTPILVLGYEYDENDSEAGAGANAAWRPFARWDSVDEASTADIHRYTTEPRYLTPMVSFIPEHSVVPSPRDFLGYTVGTEGKLTHPREEEAYFEALAAASANVNLLSMGVTEEKRNTMLVVVSSAENLTRMNEWKGYTRTLADPRAVSEAQAREVAAKGKPIMHITAGLHSPETGPPEMVMELAYRLAVSMHPGIVEIRDSVILLITPITDVDGRARVVEWYERYTKNYDACEFMPPNSPPYWGKYTYHDNNRDGVQLTQKLTTNFLNSFNEWHPVYSIDLHESVPLMYVSGGTGPYNTTLDPLVVREWQLAASWELAELQKAGLPGVWTWGYYTGWNPGYLLWITNNRNSMGRFYETFGNSHAGTFERDLSNSSFAGKKTTSRQWYRPDPPDEKVMWSLRNNTNYMQSGILASLTFTARNGSMLLYNFWQKGKNSIEKGKNEPPHAFVIPEDQEQRFRLAYLLNQLRKHGLEVHRANADFELEDGEFNEGDYIVRADQPYGNHVRNLLETQEFPSDAQWRPYDDVSWTYGLVYRVKTVAIEDAVVLSDVDMTRVEEPQAFPGSVGAGPKVAAFAVKQHGDNSMITARYRLRRHNVTASEEAFEAQGESFPLGSWIIPNRGGVRGALEDVARDCMLNFVALDEYPDVETHALDLPRIALYHNWVSTQNDGWIRYTLEQAEVPYTYINDDDIRRAGLRGHFDVIVMAHLGASLKSLIHGRDTKFGPMAYTKTRRFGAHGVLDSSRDITGGFGFRGMANLES
ncbi:MAG: M14 family zinc carboxypeptidase, partial [Candidatus Hydrogenedentes bacterium]|nr:M14 family zinc carboxypeptidase [Candidatus Hydrogenedentota bacterium]